MIVVAGTIALLGCHKEQPRVAENDDLAVETNLSDGESPPGPVIETLPADESSVTSNGDLAEGGDPPDVNEAGDTPQPH